MTTSQARTTGLPFQNWRTVLPSVLWSGMTVTALVLISRKLSGAFARELSTTAACFGVTLAMLLSFVAAALYHADRRSDSPAEDSRTAEPFLMAIIALTAPLLIGLALLPGDSLAALFYTGGLLLLLMTGIVLLATDLFSFRPKPTMILHAEFPSAELSSDTVTGIAWPPIDSSASISDSSIDVSQIDESVSQRITRTRTAAGTERIFGSMSVCFAAGQRQATAHLPFAPPLDVSPTVVCDVPAGNAVRVKVAAVHPYGARIELKRGADCEAAETIEIDFTVTADEIRTTAA